jgi:ribosomal protein S18 acetylase RimI-like enzyme
MDAGESDDHEKLRTIDSKKNEEKNEEKNGERPSEANGKKKRPDVNLREMEIDDIPEVFHIGELIFTAQEVPTLYRTWDEYEVISLFNSDSEYCLVAELDKKIIGFALGTTVSKKKSSWKYGYLVWLGILPGYQRQGVASRLFDKLAEKMIEDGVRMFMVDTGANDFAALQLFKKKGFRNPQKHIYLTMNLRTYQELQKKVGNSGKRQRNGNNRDHVSGYTT